MNKMSTVNLLLCALLLFPSCLGITVEITRDAKPSAYFNDTFYTNETCSYEGIIRLAHPMSIDRHDSYYDLGIQMLGAAHITIDKINQWPRCGVSLRKSGSNFQNEIMANYALALATYGDESSEDKTYEIGRKIVGMADFLLAGYSSGLSAILTPLSQDARKLCITAGASATAAHANKSRVFGMLPPNGLFLESAFKGLEQQGAKTVAYIAEEGEPTCGGAPDMADKYNMTFLNGTRIPEKASVEIYEQVALHLKELNPDVIFTCVRTTYDMWNQALRMIEYVPKAQVYTMIFGTPEFEEAMGDDLSFIMGVSAWDRALPAIPDGATGWTPHDFDVEFELAAARRPAYQHTAQSAAISILIQAVERLNRSDFESPVLTDLVARIIQSSSFLTVYGNVSFDENGQSAAPYLFLQYDANKTLHVLVPEDRKSTDFELHYPLPSWAARDCQTKSRCMKTRGLCTSAGECDCLAPLVAIGGAGATAQCMEPAVESYTSNTTTVALAIAIPVVVVALLGAALFVYYQQIKGKNDSVWQIKKEELVFAHPPEVVGRGTFGEVLLAEYRGTQVAVKRVLPPRKSRASKKADGDSVDESESTHPKTGLGRASNNSSNFNGKASGIASGIVSGIGTASMDGIRRTSQRDMTTAKAIRLMKQEFIREMRYLSKLRHPCIVTVMGAVVGPGQEPMLIMEYMDHGSLSDILQNETILLDGEVVLPMLRDITQGCRFLHAAVPQVIHGDLKAANILVDSRFRAKVADFGLSQKKNMGATGTPFWMAPELLRGESLNTSASDVFSFGVLLSEVYTRKDPYHDEDENPLEIVRQVADPKINKRPLVPKKCPSQLAAIMSDCLVSDPNERPTFEELDKRLKRVDVEQVSAPSQDFIDEFNSSGGIGDSSGFLQNTTVSLYDIFPKHIADALRDGKQVEPEHRDCVTIFFSDIVSFTKLSSTLEPRKVANLLDRLYNKLDKLSHRHDIFKVETIGDAYMAVTNLVKDQPDDHCKRIAEFAVDAIAAANDTLIDLDDPAKGYVNLRAGFHCGPVVADVVGSRSPRYCLFGDSVNTASRMESNSKENRIHCSAIAAELLKKQNCIYPIVPRGVIEVKGKGEMMTFWINEGENRVKVEPLKLRKPTSRHETSKPESSIS